MTPTTKDGISKLMQFLGRRYVQYFNYMYKRTGTLWEGRFKSCVVDAENYLLLCQRYIELNPVRADVVDSPADYKWSSFKSNGWGRPSLLWTPHPIYLALGKTNKECAASYQEIFKGQIEMELLNQIRESVNQGLALGNDRFKQEIEQLSGRRVTLLKRGPKPNIKPNIKPGFLL